MEVRPDFVSVNDHLQRLIKYGEAFEDNNLQHWPHLKNKEDFQSIYKLNPEDRSSLEKIYSDGRDCAFFMANRLRAFNDAMEYPTLSAFIKSFDESWVYQLQGLRIISETAKKKAKSLEHCPWAIEQMLILFDKQLELLEATKNTLKMLRCSDLYKGENGQFHLCLFCKKIWHDPVWSKVIARIIISVPALALTICFSYSLCKPSQGKVPAPPLKPQSNDAKTDQAHTPKHSGNVTALSPQIKPGTGSHYYILAHEPLQWDELVHLKQHDPKAVGYSLPTMKELKALVGHLDSFEFQKNYFWTCENKEGKIYIVNLASGSVQLAEKSALNYAVLIQH